MATSPTTIPAPPPGFTPVQAAPPPPGFVPVATTAPQESTLGAIGDTALDVGKGFIKGAGDTVSGVSHLIHKIPVVGETLAPEAGIQSLDKLDTSTNTAQSVGKGIEGIAEFAAGDEALDGVAKASKLVALAQKYPLVARTLQLATEHPWMAKMITEGAKGAAVGSVEGGVKGAQQNQAGVGALTGATLGGVTGAAVGGVSGAPEGVLNPFRIAKQIAKGKEMAQEPAEAAIRSGVQGMADTAGVSSPAVNAGIAANPVLEGNQTVLDEPLKLLENNKKAAYQTVDKAVGFDLKELKNQVANDTYNLKQLGTTPADTATRKTLTDSIANANTRITQAEAKLKAAGIDPKLGDKANTAWQAGQALKNAVVKNTGPDGTVNVNGLLKSVKNLRFSKYGDRIGQIMGNDGADEFVQDLQSAQKAGVKAMTARRIAKYVGGTLLLGGVGYEGGQHILSSFGE